MEYLTVKEVAEKWNLNVRTVQKWAKNGKLDGTVKRGRDWMVPENAVCPQHRSDESTEKTEEEVSGAAAKQTARETDAQSATPSAMPLLSGSFVPGNAKVYIASLHSKEEQQMAEAERCFFRGESARAACLTEELRQCKWYHIRLSALLVHAFSNIELRRTLMVKQDFYMISQEVQTSNERVTEEEKLFGHFVQMLCRILLHDTKGIGNPFEQQIHLLSDGLRFFGTYIMAHYYYLQKKYHQSMGIAETALTLFGTSYPIGSIYLFLVISMDMISLKEKEKAEYYFRKAWDLARKDGFLEPFAEHHGLLGGLVEKCLKETEPEAYAAIVEKVYAFSEGWRRIHNPATEEKVTSDLTTLEFSVAMLASKGWGNKEIGEQLHLSENMVKNLTRAIYQKLKISGRKELNDCELPVRFLTQS